ncbi:TIR domain-containing protein [Lentzea sp. NPDC059081]|uniref:TIR domain-containing protein n=1 Tax=Lentzea sp. NPDC059081 TaxID=3346719 RepID=UPI00369AD634
MTPSRRTIFIAFAKEDESARNLFTGQRISARTPFEFVDMSVKEPYESQWKDRVRTRIRRSSGVIALISPHTPRATGQLWEMTCAVEEGKPLMGIWLHGSYLIKPPEIASAPCRTWSWSAVADFIDGL